VIIGGNAYASIWIEFGIALRSSADNSGKGAFKAIYPECSEPHTIASEKLKVLLFAGKCNSFLGFAAGLHYVVGVKYSYTVAGSRPVGINQQ